MLINLNGTPKILFKMLLSVIWILMICEICGVNETDNPDGICDNCRVSIISSDEIPPNL